MNILFYFQSSLCLFVLFCFILFFLNVYAFIFAIWVFVLSKFYQLNAFNFKN